MINRVYLLGTVKSEPKKRGAAIVFTMTTWRNHHDGRRFDSTHTVEVFGKNIALTEELHEGDMVAVDGSIKHSSYEKNGQRVWFTSINAFSLSRTDGTGAKEQRSQGVEVKQGAAPAEYPPSQNQESKPVEAKKSGDYPGFSEEYGF